MSWLQQLWWHWLYFVARCQCQRWSRSAQCQMMVFDKELYGDWKTQVLTLTKLKNQVSIRFELSESQPPSLLNSLSSSAFCNEHLSPPRLTPLPKISWLKQNLLTVIRVHLHNNLGLAYFPTAFPFCGKYFSSTSLEWKVFEPLLNEQPVLLEV